jgi:hypothetical protein
MICVLAARLAQAGADMHSNIPSKASWANIMVFIRFMNNSFFAFV